MVKARKIHVGDFVSYAGKEWLVTKNLECMFRLVRRQVLTGPSVTVPKKRLKIADQEWRRHLEKGDPVSLFIGSEWTNASVYERIGKTLLVQPSLSNFTMLVHEDEGIISKNKHSFPLWQKDDVTHVMINGARRLERALGLVFPWYYTRNDATRVETTRPPRTFLLKLSFPVYETKGFPLRVYKNLTKDEIMSDICANPDGHPGIVMLLAEQFKNYKQTSYPHNTVDLENRITRALENGDQRHVQEMLSVGNQSAQYYRSENLVRDHLSYSYLDADFCVVHKRLEVRIFHSGMRSSRLSDCVSSILEKISSPMVYAPKIIAVDAAPEMQYILSRMLGMEQEPVDLLTTRTINGSNKKLHLRNGFCTPEMRLCGGQINVDSIDYPTLVKALMRRSPMKTLVIVETNALPMWKDFNVFHGRKRNIEQLTVTTKGIFRSGRSTMYHRENFESFERLICVLDTGWYSQFTYYARYFKCRVKWAIGCAYKNAYRNSKIFEDPEQNSPLCIKLMRFQMQDMGVEFSNITKQRVVFNVDKKSCGDFVERLREEFRVINTEPAWRNRARNDLLRRYLHHPELVCVEFRGQKLDAIEATLNKIAKKFHVDETVLNTRTQETCAVCLETITDASVTPCGHVFCSTCMVELHKRSINCPMCRAKIPSFLKLSDKNTTGTVVVQRGVPYRVAENETWGNKMLFLKKHQHATFITDDKNLKRKLKKVFRKTQILTTDEIKEHQLPISNEVVVVEPLEHNWNSVLSTAWGKDVLVSELVYQVDEAPFGTEFF